MNVLLRFIREMDEHDPLNKAMIALLYAIVTLMDTTGAAASEDVRTFHSEYLYGNAESIKTPISQTKEYICLKEHGYIYEVLKRGTLHCLKFQKPLAKELDDDNYVQLRQCLSGKIQILSLQPPSSLSSPISATEENKLHQRLFRRIRREFDNATYLSDIKINNDEYEILRAYLKNTIHALGDSGDVTHEECFAVAVVQTAVRVYRDGNLWGNFFEELDCKNTALLQGSIGKKFQNILIKNKKFHVEGTRYVQNILMHCYVSDHYLAEYFGFLCKFYSIDLDRDIGRLDKYLMNDLAVSICSEDHIGRSYMLVQHTGQAVAANPRGAKIRIRNHLKLMDKLFWDPGYERKTDHRIYSRMQAWAKTAEEMRLDMEIRGSGRGRERKHFSSPYILFDRDAAIFRMVLPSQIIRRVENADVFWRICGKSERYVEAELTESVTGYKVAEACVEIGWQEVLDKYHISLIDGEGNNIKSFPVHTANARFFDEEGYPVNANTLKVGEVTAITRPEDILYSSALMDSYFDRGMLMSIFSFEYEDILRLPDGRAVIVGKRELQSGLVGKGCVGEAVCTFKDNTYRLYHTMPHLVLRMQPQKANGTCIEVNGKRYRLFDINTVEFSIDDRSGDVGCYLNLADFEKHGEGLFEIITDIPGGVPHKWSFVLIKEFRAEFDGAPYVFEPRGVVSFSDTIDILPHGSAITRDGSSNTFNFEIEEAGRYISFDYIVQGETCKIDLPVPALFIKKEDGTWTSRRPAHIWHTEFPDVVELSVPYHKIILSMDETADDLDEEVDIRELEFRKNSDADSIICDLTKFRSYFYGDENIKTIRARFGQSDVELFKVLTQSIPVSCEIVGDFDQNIIRIGANIIGKAEYCADLFRDDALLCEKIPLTNGNALISGQTNRGTYKVKLFEVGLDDSGFDEMEYHFLGQYEQELIDPYDMNGRSFRVVQIESTDDASIVYPLIYNYYVQDLKQTKDRRIYQGTMVVEKSGGEIMAAFPVRVEFFDLAYPGRVWIGFFDEYGDPTGFLYDTRRKGILQEENSQLRKSECYRRYSFLSDDAEVYRIEFCTRKKRSYNGIQNKIIFEESSNTFGFIQHEYELKKNWKAEVYISDITWRKDAFQCLASAHFSTMSQLEEYDRNSFRELTYALDDTIDAIERTMHAYGFKFKPIQEIEVGSAKERYAESTDDIAGNQNSESDPPSEILIHNRYECTNDDTTPQKDIEIRKIDISVPKEPASVLDIKLSNTSLPPMTYNCLKNSGYRTVGDISNLYESKGTKGLLNINKSNAEMRQQIIELLKHYELI